MSEATAREVLLDIARRRTDFSKSWLDLATDEEREVLEEAQLFRPSESA